jgi:acetylornithine deacetylase
MSPSQATLDHLATLIGFDSVSRNSNLDLIDWARGLLEQAGAVTRLSFNAERSKANLFASFGEGDDGLVLSGHTDVVPVDGQDWSSDPFHAEIRGDRLYGRGACDMKGFVAVALARAPVLAAAGLRAPLHLALSFDEELGCLGTSTLIEDIRAAGVRPAGCIVGEPTSMRLVSAHKGGRLYRCRVCGRAAHSSLTPHGVNAIEHAARVIALIQQIGDEFREAGPFDFGYDVPHTTLSTNVIAGGNGSNIVPALCEFLFDYRTLPGTDDEAIFARIESFARTQVLPRMQAVDPHAAIVFERLAAIPALAASEQSALLEAACGELATDVGEKVAFGTEGSFFRQAGIPTIVCGPGSIEQAHRADEFVPLAELAACERFIDGMVGRLLS